MGTEVKNTLFRFVTMRAPELLEKDVVKKLFVQHPETIIIKFPQKDTSNPGREILKDYKSVFLKAISLTEPTKKKDVLNMTAISFEPIALKDRNAVSDFVGKKFFDFAIWLTSNRTNVTVDELVKQINIFFVSDTTTSIPKDDGSLPIFSGLNIIAIELWDNLFYQIVTFKSGYVRDAILSVLVAYFFIENHHELTDDNLDKLKKLAQARVIIPKMIFGKDDESGDIDNSKDKVATADLVKTPINTKSLDKEMSLILEKQKKDFLQGIINELTIEKNNYNKLNQKASDVAYSTY